MNALNDRLLAAHEAQDSTALVTLYQEAAAQAPDDDTRGFFLTHALVFALERNHPDADRLRAMLVKMGRELPN
jgi:hypothetical protein